MTDHLKTIRQAIELATPHFQADTERFKQALTALDALESDHKMLREALTPFAEFDLRKQGVQQRLVSQVLAARTALENTK